MKRAPAWRLGWAALGLALLMAADLRRFYDAAAGPQTNDHDRRGGPLGAAKP